VNGRPSLSPPPLDVAYAADGLAPHLSAAQMVLLPDSFYSQHPALAIRGHARRQGGFVDLSCEVIDILTGFRGIMEQQIRRHFFFDRRHEAIQVEPPAAGVAIPTNQDWQPTCRAGDAVKGARPGGEIWIVNADVAVVFSTLNQDAHLRRSAV